MNLRFVLQASEGVRKNNAINVPLKRRSVVGLFVTVSLEPRWAQELAPIHPWLITHAIDFRDLKCKDRDRKKSRNHFGRGLYPAWFTRRTSLRALCFSLGWPEHLASTDRRKGVVVGRCPSTYRRYSDQRSVSPENGWRNLHPLTANGDDEKLVTK